MRYYYGRNKTDNTQSLIPINNKVLQGADYVTYFLSFRQQIFLSRGVVR